MELTSIILLIILGLFLVLLEVFFLPGMIVGILGFIMLSVGLIWSYSAFGSVYGNLILLGIVLLFSLFTFWLIKSKLWRKVLLIEESKGKVNQNQSFLHEGDVGEAISRLAPMGTISVNGFEFEAKSQKGFIDSGQTVTIVKIFDNQIIVKVI
jgi:membrane-bound ClpP family serine protease